MTTACLASVMAERVRQDDEFRKVDRYMRGMHAPSYMPKKAQAEYRSLVQRSVTNWLPLVVSTVSQNLYVEGYRSLDQEGDADAWTYWAMNDMDSRQEMVHSAALSYGISYASVGPGDGNGPVIRSHSPLSVTGISEDPDAEWLDAAARRVGRSKRDGQDGAEWRLYDDEALTAYWVPDEGGSPDPGSFVELWRQPHDLGVCPVVPFRNRWETSPFSKWVESGEVWPLIATQDALNDTKVSLLMAQQYSAFRQRWATGMAIPEDDNGNAVEPFSAAVDRLWIAEDPDTKFGEFGQSDLTGYLKSIEAHIQHMSAVAQVPPHYLLGGMVNISAEALAAAEAGLTRKVKARQAMFGEAWSKVLRLAAGHDGNRPAAEDVSARVVWRDVESRSLGAAADAAGKLVTMLGVPEEAAWEMIPGVTPFDVKRWRRMKDNDKSADVLADVLINGAGRTAPVDEEAA